MAKLEAFQEKLEETREAENNERERAMVMTIAQIKSAEERVTTLQTTLFARDEELRNLATQHGQAQSIKWRTMFLRRLRTHSPKAPNKAQCTTLYFPTLH